jgi:FixJ family two-component response regulator
VIGMFANPILSQSDAKPSERLQHDSVVTIIDDDILVRDSIELLLCSVGFHTKGFNSAEEFLRSTAVSITNCLILDVLLPGMSGLEFQLQLAEAGGDIPIIFVTGRGDIPIAAHAMKAGAIDFLLKPFREQDLLDAVAAAIKQDYGRRQRALARSDLRARFELLTAREQDIAPHLAAGLKNRQIAIRMGLRENTVKVHRRNLMKKLGARSLPDLVRMIDVIEVASQCLRPSTEPFLSARPSSP